MVLFQVQLLFWDVFESQEMWGERHSEEEWMCWCLEVNIQYPRVTVLHAWISLLQQEQGRYGTGQEGVESKTENRNTERKIKGCESPAIEVVLENYFYLFIQPLNAVTLTGEAEHAGGAVEGWRCVSATWSSDLQQSCKVLNCFVFWDGGGCLYFSSRLTIHLGDTHQTQVMPATSSLLLWELFQIM